VHETGWILFSGKKKFDFYRWRYSCRPTRRLEYKNSFPMRELFAGLFTFARAFCEWAGSRLLRRLMLMTFEHMRLNVLRLRLRRAGYRPSPSRRSSVLRLRLRRAGYRPSPSWRRLNNPAETAGSPHVRPPAWKFATGDFAVNWSDIERMPDYSVGLMGFEWYERF
jgi:hypothetical protein